MGTEQNTQAENGSQERGRSPVEATQLILAVTKWRHKIITEMEALKTVEGRCFAQGHIAAYSNIIELFEKISEKSP